MYHLGGVLETLDEVRARNAPTERILVSNMECNGYAIIVVNTNSWKSAQPFNEGDMVVDAHGEIVERGDTPERIAYRAAKIAEHQAELARFTKGEIG